MNDDGPAALKFLLPNFNWISIIIRIFLIRPVPLKTSKIVCTVLFSYLQRMAKVIFDLSTWQYESFFVNMTICCRPRSKNVARTDVPGFHLRPIAYWINSNRSICMHCFTEAIYSDVFSMVHCVIDIQEEQHVIGRQYKARMISPINVCWQRGWTRNLVECVPFLSICRGSKILKIFIPDCISEHLTFNNFPGEHASGPPRITSALRALVLYH